MGYSRSGPVKRSAPKILISHFVKNVSKICLPYSLDLLRYTSQNSTHLLPWPLWQSIAFGIYPATSQSKSPVTFAFPIWTCILWYSQAPSPRAGRQIRSTPRPKSVPILYFSQVEVGHSHLDHHLIGMAQILSPPSALANLSLFNCARVWMYSATYATTSPRCFPSNFFHASFKSSPGTFESKTHDLPRLQIMLEECRHRHGWGISSNQHQKNQISIGILTTNAVEWTTNKACRVCWVMMIY